MQAIISGAVGGAAGMVLGAFLAPFQSNIATMETDNMPIKDQFRYGMREIGAQSRSWGKNLLVIGAVFSCSECFVEKARGRTDRWNPIYGGCITGAALAASGAPSPPPLCALIPASCQLHALTRCLQNVSHRSRTAGDGHRLRWLRSLLGCHRRNGLRPLRRLTGANSSRAIAHTAL